MELLFWPAVVFGKKASIGEAVFLMALGVASWCAFFFIVIGVLIGRAI